MPPIPGGLDFSVFVAGGPGFRYNPAILNQLPMVTRNPFPRAETM